MTTTNDGGGVDEERALSLGHVPSGRWAFDDEVTTWRCLNFAGWIAIKSPTP